jgi:hypothetical protein
MKFNKLARELNLSVNDLAEQVKAILPNANGGTEVNEEQQAEIIALLQMPSADSALSLFTGDGSDPILSILMERIAEESQRETPEQILDEMIYRYLANPEDLPADPEYREAIITYVSLLKKRQARKQQRSLRLRSRLSRNANEHSTVEPLVLESFYSSEPNTDSSSATLNGNGQSPQLAAASS